MGGCKPPAATERGQATLAPDTAHNNMFDEPASEFFYERCQELGVRACTRSSTWHRSRARARPCATSHRSCATRKAHVRARGHGRLAQVPLVVVSRYAAYGAKMPRDVYDQLAQSGSTIGWRLRNVQRESIEQLWRRAVAPEGSAARAGLPARCDRGWFIKTFCGNRDDPSRSGGDTVWDLVDGFMQYDTIALLASVPSLREQYFLPKRVSNPMHPVTSLIIGDESSPGLREPRALVQLLQRGYTEGLGLNHRKMDYVILLVQLRWENLTDMRLTLVMMRALWGMGKLDCVGTGPSPRTSHASLCTAHPMRHSAPCIPCFFSLYHASHASHASPIG